MRIEVLQSPKDAAEFVEKLYGDDYYLLHSNTYHKLSMEEASRAVAYNAISVFGAYYIGKGDIPDLVSFDTCYFQSHPLYLGKPGGRSAGVLAEHRDCEEADALMKQIAKYIRKHYSFRRYNGEHVRMCCHFGPDYQKQDTKFFANPSHSGVRLGYMCARCALEETAAFDEHLKQCLSDDFWIEGSWQWLPSLDDDTFMELKTQIWYNENTLRPEQLADIAQILSGCEEKPKVKIHSQLYSVRVLGKLAICCRRI